MADEKKQSRKKLAGVAHSSCKVIRGTRGEPLSIVHVCPILRVLETKVRVQNHLLGTRFANCNFKRFDFVEVFRPESFEVVLTKVQVGCEISAGRLRSGDDL